MGLTQNQTDKTYNRALEALENNRNIKKRDILAEINSLIQEIKQDPTISVSQRNYAIKKMEELAERL